jgi:hypothetical protein
MLMTPIEPRRPRRSGGARQRVRGGWWEAVGIAGGALTALTGTSFVVFPSPVVAVGETDGGAEMMVVSAVARGGGL